MVRTSTGAGFLPRKAGVSDDRTGIEAAVAWIDSHAKTLPAESVPIAEAAGRIVAEEVSSSEDLPSFDQASIDGFALRAEETIGASTYNPLSFRLVPAGGAPAPGCAVRVNAGDAMPSGADGVVAWEHVADDDDASIAIVEAIVAGAGVASTGSHVRRSDVIVPAGRRLRPDDIGLLAMAGVTRLSVVRRPRVQCLLVGRALRDAGEPQSIGATRDADSLLLHALVERDGGVPRAPHRVDRTLQALRDALAEADADLILVVGGSGAGPDDFASTALSDAGECVVHGVAFRPSETLGIGRTAAGIPVFLLPGAPAACLWAYEMFAGRALRQRAGRSPDLPFAARTMTTARKIVSEIGMVEVHPVRLRPDGTVVPLASFAEAGLSAAARADGFILVPEGSEGYPQGASVLVYFLDDVRRS